MGLEAAEESLYRARRLEDLPDLDRRFPRERGHRQRVGGQPLFLGAMHGLLSSWRAVRIQSDDHRVSPVKQKSRPGRDGFSSVSAAFWDPELAAPKKTVLVAKPGGIE